MDTQDLLSADEARAMLGISRTTLHRLLASNELQGRKVGGQWRFRRTDLEAYLAGGPAMGASALGELETEANFWADALRQAGGQWGLDAGANAEERLEAMATAMLTLALLQAATDVHIEPGRGKTRFRFRADGILKDVREMAPTLAAALVTRLKEMARMNAEEKTLPQDGRLKMRQNDKDYNLRVSTLPTMTGEAVAIHIVPDGLAMPTLAQLAAHSVQASQLESIAALPNGIVLIAGSAGSGKTTTVYALLEHHCAQGRKVVTVEEPLDYHVPGTLQVPLKRSSGFTYTALLRAVRRQDPDVVFVDSVPDQETAEEMVATANIGCLVIANLPAADAVEAVAMWQEVSGGKFAAISVLRAATGQKLLRRNCAACVTPQNPEPAHLEGAQNLAQQLGLEWPQQLEWRQGSGCAQCRQTGYRGRMAVYETLVVDRPLREALQTGANLPILHQVAARSGLLPMFAGALQSAAQGQTSLQEVLETFPPGQF